jgi:hypothetical protein
MRNRKAEGAIIFFCGLVCIAAGAFVFFTANKIYPDSGSSRVQDLNWLLQKFGKTGTAVLFSVPGLWAIYAGGRRMRNR